MIALASGLRVYLACGVTDMRKGMVGLSMLVQQTLAEDPFGGAVFAFRGRRAGLIKLIWHDGVGLCLAEAPARPIDGGMPTEALIVHVVVSKFCDSLPLYRQSQMLAHQGITLDRSTLSRSACWWLTPLYELVVATVLSSPKIFADDTSLPVLDPGRGRTKTGHLWTSYGLSSDKLSCSGVTW